MLPAYKTRKLRLFLNSHLFPAITSFVLFMIAFTMQVRAETVPFNMVADSRREKIVINEGSIILSSSTPMPTPSPVIPNPTPTETRTSLFEMIRRQMTQTEVEASPVEKSGCGLANTFTPEVLKWKDDICRWSEEHKMDSNLIATIMQIESCGNNSAVSFTGVRGLFQVTGANLDGGNPFDPNVSMAKGPGKVLKNEIEAAGGDIKAAMAGYNGGGLARQYIKGEMSKNELYLRLRNHPSGLWRSNSKALAKINEVERYAQWSGIYFEAQSGRRDTLQEWLDLGGHRLCTAANNS